MGRACLHVLLVAAMNKRPCGACRNLDARALTSGVQYCWSTYVWRRPEEVVADCKQAERADGREPVGRIHFTGEQR